MSSAGSTVPEGGASRRILSVWIAPVVVLVGVWLWLVFSSGGYIAHQWLPPSLALGLFGLVVTLLVAYPRRPRQLSLALLVLFACYSLWVALSAVWADSTSRVWMESGRTFSYLLVFALALIYFTDPAARRTFRYLVMAAAAFLLVACVWRLWASGSIAGLFLGNRLYYPVRYPNNAGALFLVAFWPLMWLASGTEERAPVRGVALGLATGLLGLAIMTQSRGAIWSLAITVVIMFVISPARLRLLFYLLVPALLMAYEFPNLNRYWLEGPVAVGGGAAARTLVVASITAAFMGMILALLERWVKISRRMKAIFGTIVLLGALAGSIYGSITLTSEAGGPFKWVSQTWRQFTGQIKQEAPTEDESRFTLLTSSGRVDIWKVAWQAFTAEPLRGIGADNYVFQYDRLRSRERTKPQQAHSLELQVLGETGAVGGVFAFGGILLALGGLLWPRCTAGWRGARLTWLGRRPRAEDSPPDVPLEPAETLSRWCNPRWGNDARIYGWEMALLAGAAYWLIHASVDWLWQMAGVSIPALLFVAAGVAGVDARAGVLWPHLSRWLRIGAPVSPAEAPAAEETRPGPDQAELVTGPQSVAADETPSIHGLMMAPRRAEQHAARAGRRARRKARRADSFERLQPPGLLSHVFRALMVALSLVVLVVAGLPYLSLQIQDSATALAKIDGQRAVKRADSARWLLPSDPAPYLTQASIYERSALEALGSESPDRAGAVLDNLALSIDRLEGAIALEPADWSTRYEAGVAVLNLLLAREHVAGNALKLDYEALTPMVMGLQDWSALSISPATLPEPGIAAGSLAADQTSRAIAGHYRSVSQRRLLQLASDYLAAATQRNPLEAQTRSAMDLVQQIQNMMNAIE